MSFKNILQRWQAMPARTDAPERYRIRLDVEDAARVEALAELFPGVDTETVLCDLISAALDETEAAMPYEAGERVIREDEFGDPVYEDTGLTPRYIALTREKRRQLGQD